VSLLNPGTFLTRKDAAALLRDAGVPCTATTLQNIAGRSGPPYRILRGRAVYLRGELEQWLEKQVRGTEPTQAA
jgi:hypothetical protein